MNFDLTDEQFGKLVRLAYLGMWVAEAHTHEKESYFKEIEQILFEKAYHDKTLNSYVKYDEKNKRYLPSSGFDSDEVVSRSIDEYEEHLFWDELIDRLSKKDLLDKYGMDKIQKMSFMERLDKEKIYMDLYEKEFGHNGINNVTVKIDKP